MTFLHTIGSQASISLETWPSTVPAGDYVRERAGAQAVSERYGWVEALFMLIHIDSALSM